MLSDFLIGNNRKFNESQNLITVQVKVRADGISFYDGNVYTSGEVLILYDNVGYTSECLN